MDITANRCSEPLQLKITDIRACNVPICTSEDIYPAENLRPLMENGGVSAVHPDILTVDGALEMKKLGQWD